MIIAKLFDIEMAHRLPSHKGKCKNVHGHTYTMEVAISGIPNENGIIIDFQELKQTVTESIINKFDHRFVVWSQDEINNPQLEPILEGFKFANYIPTVENLSRDFFERIKRELSINQMNKSLKLQYVKLWETKTSFAIYDGSDDILKSEFELNKS